MAYEYFSAFPLVEYNGVKLRNLMTRAKLNTAVIGSKYHFLPYTMSYHENVTSLAHDYYGNVDWSWLVLLSSGKIDPFHAYAHQDEELDALIKREYGSIEAAQSKILYWVADDGREISNESKQILLALGDPDVAAFSTAINAYDYFAKLNESKRQVGLVNRDYAQEIHQELRVKMRDSVN